MKRTSLALLVSGLTAMATTLLFVVTATAETRYASPNGLTSGQCDSPAISCTITRAASLSGPGDTLILSSTFTAAKYSLTLNGTQAQPITVKGPAVLDAKHVPMSPTDSALRCLNCSWVTFRDFTIQNSFARGLSFSGDNPSRSHHITIENVTVLHVGERAIGGSGDDVVIRAVYVEYAAEANETNGEGGGWAGAISSYTFGDGTPSHRWSLLESHIAYVRGECAIALRVIGWLAERNTFTNCYNIYTDKAQQVVWNANTVIQQPGWGKFGGTGDGFKSANENPQLVPALFISDLIYTNNILIGVKDCFSYWHVFGGYSRVTITGNDCRSTIGALSDFDNIPPGETQPTGNTFKANLCTGSCATYFGDANDRAGWAIEIATAVATETRTPIWTSSVTPTFTTRAPSASPTPTMSPIPSLTRTATQSPSPSITLSPSQTFTPAPLWSMTCPGRLVIVGQVVTCWP